MAYRRREGHGCQSGGRTSELKVELWRTEKGGRGVFAAWSTWAPWARKWNTRQSLDLACVLYQNRRRIIRATWLRSIQGRAERSSPWTADAIVGC